MVVVQGQLRSATGLPLQTPITLTLTDYGVSPPDTLYLPVKVTVQPDIDGTFEVELWANQTSSHPCYYRVETPQGSSFLISVPGGVLGPLEIGSLVVTKPDLREDTNILHRLALLEARDGGGCGGVGDIDPLTAGDGLTGGPFDGTAPVTFAVSSTIARINSPTFVDPRSNHPAPGDSSTRLATTNWASNAANLTSGTIPSERLPSGILTDPREWSALTVTLTEVQTGTDTSRKAFTVQRVWQAITAWWATVEVTIAKVASPALTGTPTTPTPSAGNNSTQIANTEWASNAANLTQGTIPAARVPTLNQSTTGNSATTTKLATPRNILGRPFDGTADLDLTVGAGLTLSGTTLSLDGTDVRLSDAREWTAATVTQVDAEVGTSTIRVAWTALRVRQAIAAWWATIDATIARLASPNFTGIPTAPTAAAGNNSTQIATTAWASNAANLTQGTISASRVPTLNQSTTGNAATATKLAAAVNIGITGSATATGVAFDGTQNISLAVSSLDAAGLTGTIADARLSSNIPRLSSYIIGLLSLQAQGSVSNSGTLSATSQVAAWVATGGVAVHSYICAGASAGSKVVDHYLDTTGVFSLRRLSDTYGSPNTAYSVDTSGNVTFPNFTTFGSGNTGLKCKVLTGTTGATQGSTVSVAHGITSTKIVSYSGVIFYSAGNTVPINSQQANYASIVASDSTNISLTCVSANSAGILGVAFKVIVWYTA